MPWHFAWKSKSLYLRLSALREIPRSRQVASTQAVDELAVAIRDVRFLACLLRQIHNGLRPVRSRWKVRNRTYDRTISRFEVVKVQIRYGV